MDTEASVRSLPRKFRHAPAAGLLTSGFTMTGTDTWVPNPPSCLAIGDNRPETVANKVEAPQVGGVSCLT